MAEIEELRAKVIASMSSSANQKKSPKNKEEGELSTSDDDEIPTCSSAVTPTATSPPAESTPAPMTRSNQCSRTGKFTPENDPASSADARLKTSAKQTYSKSFVRTSVPTKPGNKWYAPSVPNNNLVISFSDDDSGSDSQEQRLDETSERKGVGFGAEISSAQPEPRYTPKNANKQAKRMPKMVSLNRTRTFVSSLTKIHGANSRGSQPSLAEQVTRSRNSAAQEHEGSSGNNSKLEDLRQQIAIRENQLKLKSVQQNKITNAHSYHDHNDASLNKNAVKKSRPASGNTTRADPDEREKKRLKLEPYHRKSNQGGQHQMLGSVSKPAPLLSIPTLEINRQKDGNLTSCSQFPKEGAVGTVDLFADKQLEKVGNQNPVISANLVPGMKDSESSKLFNQTTSINVPNYKLPSKHGGYSSDISTSFFPSGTSSRSTDHPAVLNRSSLLLQMTSREDDGGACQFNTSSPKNSNRDGPNVPGTFGAVRSSSIDKAAQHNVAQISEYNAVIPGDRILAPLKDNLFDKCTDLIQQSTFGASNVSPNNTGLQNYSGQMNPLGHQHMNIQTLVEMEESHDKELEEAQEHRHRCELEERNALKAHREAQRALFEANARCTYLYRKRDLFSAQFRALMMEDATSLWSSMGHAHPKSRIDNVPEADLDNIPALGHQTHAEFEVLNSDSNVRGTDGDIVHTSCQQMREHNLVSEQRNEPDDSMLDMSHLKGDDAVNGACTPSHHTNISADEDEEAALLGHKTRQSIMHEDVENFEKRVRDFNANLGRVSTFDNANDYAVLEAALRSELFARLGANSVLKNKNKNLDAGEGHIHNIANESVVANKNSDTLVSNKPYAESGKEQISNTGGMKIVSKDTNLHDGEEYTPNNGLECLVANKDSDAIMPDTPYVNSGEEQNSTIGGTATSGKNSCWPSIKFHTLTHGLGDKYSDNVSHRIDDPEESSSSLAIVCRSTTSTNSLPSPLPKYTFSYVRVTPLISFRAMQTKTHEEIIKDTSHEEESPLDHSEILVSVLRARSRGNMGEVGCYACNILIDPFWPVCMFELRGKCNDEECLWQHLKDCFGKKMKQHDCSESAACEVAPSSDFGKFSRTSSQSYHQCIKSAPQLYLVGLDLLKADLRSSGSVLTHGIGRCWQKGVSIFSGIPFTIHRTPFPNVPSFNGGDGRQGSRSRRSMYIQSQDDSLIRHALSDPEQCLDMALVLFDGDVNKIEGASKVRTMLSRALEANPTSVALWIVYLHIHYRNATAIGKDDMFSHAIRYNEGSYELWLMYINSRAQLLDRLVSYDAAISALCQHAYSTEGDRVHASACTLDLFLQLVDCLCMSGDVGKAIQGIYGLVPLAMDVAKIGSILLSDVLACLTVSDKCIFWICCVYILIYKKLPDVVVQQFEFEKELQFVIEWPSVQLTVVEKHRALELMKMGFDSVASNGGMHQREVHFLSVSHVQCVAVLEGIECGKNLLDRYINAYPTCLELVLLSARLRSQYLGDLSFEVLEDTFRNWPSEIPGIQCIWNQYAQCALESGRFDFAKQVMAHWFDSLLKLGCPQNEKVDVMEDNGLYHSPESLSPKPDVCFRFSNPKDELFGLLNLSLHRLFQNDYVKARLAIDRALKVAAPEDFMHCVREHAVFVSSDLLDQMKGAPFSGILSFLNIYLSDTRSLPFSEPLSRKFCQYIRKPRVRQLINNILGPIQSNCSLINSVLESWYGPSLLPEEYGNVKDLVDLVETLMDLYPANYSLASAVCNLITKKFSSGSIGSASVLFWASSILVHSIYQAMPVAPEHKWLEAAGIVSNLVEAQSLSERFHQHALSVYPFSIKLWKSYYNFSTKTGNGNSVIHTARERGLKLD